jgi:hypothetical protein
VHPPVMPLPDAQHKQIFLKYARQSMWREYSVLKAIAGSYNIIKTYGFGCGSRGWRDLLRVRALHVLHPATVRRGGGMSGSGFSPPPARQCP